ncbi:helix-turn-helix domain-containing protein [Burkholderia multivorans]|uniref:helix-turn-helix domain-containing protein n=1 Tax=Burkholderia multivorans TaxID=87883 RepID=UPI0021C234F7|nr:helix-turn-helix domain-containing protein [Burkholderia multivorans]
MAVNLSDEQREVIEHAAACLDLSDLSAERELADQLRALLAPTQQPSGEVTEQPSLTNPLTPYGMLVRALRIVAGTTLMDMADALLTTPAKLSAMEFGRAPVTPEFAFDVGAYFDALGVPHTASALRASVDAARAQGGDHE